MRPRSVSAGQVFAALADPQRRTVVESARAGRETRYRLTPAPLTEALDWMVSVGAEWDQRLGALRRYLTATRTM